MMKIWLARIFLTCIFTAGTFSLTTILRAETIGDRLLLDINGLQYTQRQFESYLLVRGMLLSGGQTAHILSNENWRSSLQSFEQAMMIEQEAFRLGGFQPSELMVETSMEIIKKKGTPDSEEGRQMQRLGLDDKASERIVASILRAEGMRRSRQRAASDNNVTGGGRRQAGLEEEWLVDLKRRAVVRRYNGAESYIMIKPVQP